MSNTVNLNSNNDCIKKTAKKSSKSTGIYQFIFYYKVLIYTEFDCEFQQKKKTESNNISVKLHSRKDRAHLLVSYKLFFFSYKPYQYLGISVASSGKNYKQISTLLFVSFSVNSSSGVSFSGPTSTANENFPKVSCRHSTVS